MIARLLCVALAAWLGGGAVAYGSGHTRFGLTPSIAMFIAAVAAAILVRKRASAVLVLVLLLPWLPFRVPAAALIWTGHAAVWIWLLVAAAIAAAWIRERSPERVRSLIKDPARAPLVAFAIAAVLFVAAAWRTSSQLPQGDEPHYLVIAQSLLADHDLQIENNHRRGDYRTYFRGELQPDYLRRGIDGQIYSVHAPGLPAIVAPAFALFGYAGVVVFLALTAAAAGALAWIAAWHVAEEAAAAWFGWAAVTLSAPFFVQSFMVYPDAPAGALVMIAVTTLLLGREATVRRLAATGVALAVLPWLHTRVALLAAGMGAAIAVRQAGQGSAKRIAALAAAPAIAAVAWFAFFYSFYGTLDPRAPYAGAQQMAWSSLPRGAIGLLLDQQFGLLPNAPVYLFAALGLVPLARRRTRLTLELTVALGPYVLAVAAFRMWWAGYTTPARLLVPVLLPLAIPMAVWFSATRHRPVRKAALAALALSLLVTATIVFVDKGALLLNFRDGASRLLTWLSPVADLTTAVPSLFQHEPAAVLSAGAVWLAAAAAALAIGRTGLLRRLTSEHQQLAIGGVALVLAMTAAGLVWALNGTPVLRPDGGSLAYLTTYDGDAQQLAMSLTPLRPVRRADVPARLALVDVRPTAGAPLADVRHVPAATYRVELTLARSSSGHLTVALDRNLGPTWSFDVAATGSWRREVVVPVASRTLIVDADPSLRSAIDRVTVRAITVRGSKHLITAGEAEQAARYGRTLMFVLDGRAYMEPIGTWIEGGASADLAIVTDDRQPVQLLVRTAPVANDVTFDGDLWHQDVPLAPDESKIVNVPVPRMRVGVRAGARPSEFEPGSTDVRLLGVWLEPR